MMNIKNSIKIWNTNYLNLFHITKIITKILRTRFEQTKFFNNIYTWKKKTTTEWWSDVKKKNDVADLVPGHPTPRGPSIMPSEEALPLFKEVSMRPRQAGWCPGMMNIPQKFVQSVK